MFKRKSIVLSDVSNSSNKKAVLSLEEDGVGIRGTLRLYNFPFDLSGISSLGFYVDQKVYKAGLTYKSHMLYEFFISLKDIPQKFSCAVVNFQNAVATPILYGSSEGNNENIYGDIISQISKDSSVSNTKKTLDSYGVDFDEDEKKQIEKDIDMSLCNACGNCTDCVYKKYFYANHSENEVETTSATKSEEKIDLKNENEEKEQPKQEDDEIVFFDRLKPQIDKLFEKNPIEDNLQKLIPNSKWVKVEYEDDGDFYVFGLLYDEKENVKYVCYGVPAVFEEEAPKELSGYPIWLPLDKENSNGFGYWLTYQDAMTGEPVKAILD